MQLIDLKVAKERLNLFQKESTNFKLEYRKNLLNTKSNVLFENNIKNKNEFFGRDEFSNSVIVKSNENLIGEIREVKITNINQNTLFGEILNKTKGIAA